MTADLRLGLPPKGRSWGIARMILNIFLRDGFYTSYLREEFVHRAETSFELPLDSITARRLISGVGAKRLAPWPGVKWLQPSESREFQAAAAAGVAASLMRVPEILTTPFPETLTT
jgi:hypothetical protein